MSFIWNSVEYKNPGVHQETRIVGGSGVVETEFKVPVIIASSMTGIPWNASDGQDPVRLFERDWDVGQEFGFDTESPDNDAYGLCKYYFKGTNVGGVNRPVYIVNMRPITNCQNVSLDTGKLVLNARIYGPPTNVYSLGAVVATGKVTVTITQPKNVRFITATYTATTDTVIEVDDTTPFNIGDTIYLYQADGTSSEKSNALTVSAVGAKSLTLAAAASGADVWTAAKYAFIYTPDSDNAVVSEEMDATYENLSNYLQAAGYFYEDTASSYTAGEAIPATITAADWESFISAEGDKAQGADLDDADTTTGTPAFIAWFEDQIIGEKKLRFFTVTGKDCAAVSDVKDRALLFKDFANLMNNTHEYRVFFYFGNLLETTDLTKTYPSTADADQVNPSNFAFTMGTQYIQYCATKNDLTVEGIDGNPGYYFAAFTMGEECGHGPTFHNQTLSKIDVPSIGFFTKTESKALNTAGVTHAIKENTAALKGFFIALGCNTFRSQVSGNLEEVWDEIRGQIGLPHAPHIVAHWEQSVRDSLLKVIPNDTSQGDPAPVRAILAALGRTFTKNGSFRVSSDGSVPPHQVNQVETVPGGVVAKNTINVRGVTNHIAVTNNINNS